MNEEERSHREEAAELAAALGAHLERLRDSGAFGLPRAEPAVREERIARDRPAREEPVTVEREIREEPAALRPPGAAKEDAVATRPGDAAVRLSVLASEVSACTRCPLHEARKQAVFARGDGSSGLCFVGEGPGADEDAAGYPFVGKAGQLLDKMIAAMGFSRDEVYVCNIVKCRPPNNRKPEPDEMAACKPYLAEQLDLVKPKVIVALGATAVEGLLGIGGGITRLRGSWRLYNGIPVMPTFHPAFLLRQPQSKREVWNDLQEVLKHLGRTVPK